MQTPRLSLARSPRVAASEEPVSSPFGLDAPAPRVAHSKLRLLKAVNSPPWPSWPFHQPLLGRLSPGAEQLGLRASQEAVRHSCAEEPPRPGAALCGRLVPALTVRPRDRGQDVSCRPWAWLCMGSSELGPHLL